MQMARQSTCLLFQVILAVTRGFSGLLPHQKSMDQGIEVAIQDAIHIAYREFCAVILDQPIGRQDVAADLAAEVDLEFGIFDLPILGLLLIHLEFVEFRAKLLYGAGPIFVLRAFVLTLHDKTGGQVGHANGRVCPVDVLASGAAGAEGVDTQIFGPDIDGYVVFDLRVYEHRRK